MLSAICRRLQRRQEFNKGRAFFGDVRGWVFTEMEEKNPDRANFACARSAAMESNKEFDFVPAESNRKLESCGERKTSQAKIFNN